MTRTRPVLASTLALMMIAAPALATHDLDLFELDRDAVDSSAPSGGSANLPDDWTTVNLPLPSGSGGSSFAHTGVIVDPLPDPTKFTGGGSKDNNDLGQWQFIVGNPSPDKDNITNAYAAAYTNPDNDHLIIYFGLDRYANNGTAQVGFWFFQNSIGTIAPDNPTNGTFTGVHRDGDVLVQSNFTQGGALSRVSVFKWRSDGNGSNGFLDLIAEPSNADCFSNAPTADSVCATVNTGDTSAPWSFTPKFGTSGTFPAASFFEAGIDLTGLGLTGCFSTFLAETRSSASFDSVLKDFVGPRAFSTCGIAATKSCTAAPNAAGTGITVSVSGQVCNNGAQTVTGLTVVDDQAGSLTSSLSSTTLAPSGQTGACATYSGSYTSTVLENEDTVTAQGTGGGQTISAEASAECTATVSRVIRITKTCEAAVNSAGTGVNISFSGQVCNDGTEQLTGVSVSNDKGGVTTQPSGTLAPGACSSYSGSYTSSSAANTDTVTATGTGAISGSAASDTDTASCSATLTPRISVTKQCSTALVLDASTNKLTVKVEFSGQVCAENASGDSNVQLTGVSVTETHNGQTQTVLSGATLAPGACQNYSGSFFPTSLSGSDGTSTDTVSASGTGALGAGSVQHNNVAANCDLCPLS